MCKARRSCLQIRLIGSFLPALSSNAMYAKLHFGCFSCRTAVENNDAAGRKVEDVFDGRLSITSSVNLVSRSDFGSR